MKKLTAPKHVLRKLWIFRKFQKTFCYKGQLFAEPLQQQYDKLFYTPGKKVLK
jgi:hypothetical protein